MKQCSAGDQHRADHRLQQGLAFNQVTDPPLEGDDLVPEEATAMLGAEPKIGVRIRESFERDASCAPQ